MILMYHKIGLHSPTIWWVDVSSFYSQMCSLAGREVVYLDDYDPTNENQVVITFDGIYKNVADYAGPILESFGYPFELFISSDWIGLGNSFDLIEPPADFADADELARLVKMGGRLQWHTRSHPKLVASRQDSDWAAIANELQVPEEVRALDPSGFEWFAYPYGVFSEDVVAAVKESFSGAVSCNQGNDSDIYKLNRLTVTNQPLPGMPRLCVIIVSYNYGAYLSEAIESVLSQTCKPSSIMIMDDASSDITSDVARKYASIYPELITSIRNEKNLGIVDTFNKAASLSESDFICFLGADNRIPSNYIESCMKTLLSEKADIAYTDLRLFGENALEEYLRHDTSRQGRIIENIYHEIKFPDFKIGNMLQGNFIHGSSIYSRNAFNAVGGYHERRLGRPEDANLFRRMLAAGHKARKASGTWLEYRQHSTSQANAISRMQGEIEFLRVYSKRLELKVKVLQAGFGLLSPFVKVLGALESRLFKLLMGIARIWRRITR